MMAVNRRRTGQFVPGKFFISILEIGKKGQGAAALRLNLLLLKHLSHSPLLHYNLGQRRRAMARAGCMDRARSDSDR